MVKNRKLIEFNSDADYEGNEKKLIKLSCDLSYSPKEIWYFLPTFLKISVNPFHNASLFS